MKIKAMQKLTLLDFPGHTAVTVFTEGCNLRCPFCHNSSLVVDKDDTYLNEKDVFDLIEKRKGLLDGVAITGGEPLLQPDIADFMREVRARGFAVKLDTNGSMPDKLKELLDEGLVDYVAMDVKSSKERYFAAAGIPGIDVSKFDRSIRIIKESGVDYEFRTTLVKGIHECEDIQSVCRWIGPDAKYFIQMYVDSGDVLANRGTDEEMLSAFSYDEATAILEEAKKLNSTVKIRGL